MLTQGATIYHETKGLNVAWIPLTKEAKMWYESTLTEEDWIWHESLWLKRLESCTNPSWHESLKSDMNKRWHKRLEPDVDPSWPKTECVSMVFQYLLRAFTMVYTCTKYNVSSSWLNFCLSRCEMPSPLKFEKSRINCTLMFKSHYKSLPWR